MFSTGLTLPLTMMVLPSLPCMKSIMELRGAGSAPLSPMSLRMSSGHSIDRNRRLSALDIHLHNADEGAYVLHLERVHKRPTSRRIDHAPAHSSTTPHAAAPHLRMRVRRGTR